CKGDLCHVRLQLTRCALAPSGNRRQIGDEGLWRGTRGFASVTEARRPSVFFLARNWLSLVKLGTQMDDLDDPVRHQREPGQNTSQDRDLPADQQRTGESPPRCAGVPRWKGCAP